jgi:hypothetical protein
MILVNKLNFYAAILVSKLNFYAAIYIVHMTINLSGNNLQPRHLQLACWEVASIGQQTIAWQVVKKNDSLARGRAAGGGTLEPAAGTVPHT